MDDLKLGQIIEGEQFRDAIHIAVAPVEAAHHLDVGQHVGLDANGRATAHSPLIGVVDPFLKAAVTPRQKFWLFLYPNTVTSMRHHWAHPNFTAQETVPQVVASAKEASVAWMRAWAIKHMGSDYYGDGDRICDDAAYENAIRAGHEMSVFCWQDAADHIDNEWWGHWEAITGKNGQRGEYFSCAC